MKLNKNKVLKVGLIMLLVIVFCLSVRQVFTVFERGVSVSATQQAHYKDYSSHTTPLPNNVVNDLCSKLTIKDSSESCKPDAVVYAPELFDEIMTYFNGLPEEKKNYKTVENILGKYLVDCTSTTSSGHYRCDYDFRGDKVYPIVFFFNEKDFYIRIVASGGGGS